MRVKVLLSTLLAVVACLSHQSNARCSDSSMRCTENEDNNQHSLRKRGTEHKSKQREEEATTDSDAEERDFHFQINEAETKKLHDALKQLSDALPGPNQKDAARIFQNARLNTKESSERYMMAQKIKRKFAIERGKTNEETGKVKHVHKSRRGSEKSKPKGQVRVNHDYLAKNLKS